MADLSVKFADGSNQYTFSNIQAFYDTFGDAVPSTSRMAGMHGGFDAYGSEDAPSAVGQVNLTFILVATTKNDMQAKIDAVRKLRYLGKQKLYFQPQGSLSQRYCYARINNISVARRPADQTDLIQLVSMSFQVSDPFWYGSSSAAGISAVGVSTYGIITNDGNAMALARITIAPGVGYQAENPTIQRIVSGSVVDEVSYIGTLVNPDSLDIDARKRSVTLNGSGAYSMFDYMHPDWMRIKPGSNDIQVVMDNAGDRAAVVVYIYPTYR